MLYDEITNQDLSYVSVCSLSILYNGKVILMTTSLGTNAVIVKRVHCITALFPGRDDKAQIVFQKHVAHVPI